MVFDPSSVLVEELKKFISESDEGNSSNPIKPAHRVPFHWPPHPVSKDFHVLASDWTGSSELVANGQTFEVEIARTAQGVFGRVVKVWNEARGATIEEVVEDLKFGAEPYFKRQNTISETLKLELPFVGRIADLSAAQLVKLLYCCDRDVAHEAQLVIESNASAGVYADALIEILRDNQHPHRRSAQWCVLDMFEDLPSFCRDSESQSRAIAAIADLIANAGDDYARTIYKAGVVLGGHICTDESAEALFRCTAAASKFGRRSAIHAVFHLAEWMPEYRDRIVETLESCAKNDPELALREFAASMANDIRSKSFDHMTEPAFPEES